MLESGHPSILLIMDDDGEESQAVHILAKYHFTNSLLKVRKAGDAIRHFTEVAQAGLRNPRVLPEMIILSVEEPAQVSLALASRKSGLDQVPLVIVAGTRDIEESIRNLALPRAYCIGKPLGFFKLLEAMQKLGMFWVVLRSNPGKGTGGA